MREEKSSEKMATIKEKLRLEAEKSLNTVILHREGVFYIAYEHSAWLFSVAVHTFKVKKQYVKCVGRDVVSIGFPMNSLEKLAAGRSLAVENGAVHLVLPQHEVPCEGTFEEWKSAQPLCASSAVRSETVSATAADVPVLRSHNPGEAEVLARLRAFPVESRTPVECMCFVAELKQLLNGCIYRT